MSSKTTTALFSAPVLLAGAIIVALASGAVYLLARQASNTGSAGKGLRDLAGPFLIGYASIDNFDSLGDSATYQDIARREFNILTPENAMKWNAIHPLQATYSFGPADRHVAFARANNMQVHGHALVWHNQNPGWLAGGAWTEAALTEVLNDHVDTVMGHYRGQVLVWDVVNEAFGDDGEFRPSLWFNTIGEDYIELAFRRARAADPDARLIYNDYNIETIGAKSDAVYGLVSDFKSRGVPIDGVGFQMHLTGGGGLDMQDFVKNMQRFSDLDLEIYITEMDVRYNTPISEEQLSVQAAIYRDVLNRCLAQPACKALQVWGVTDKYSWVPQFFDGEGEALIFDADYRPKPAYFALKSELGTHPRTTP